jgi:Sigma-70 region 2
MPRGRRPRAGRVRQVLKYRATFRDEGRFETWLYRIARNARVDYFKSRRRLEPTAGFEVVEENNRMVIPANANDSVELLVTVPTRTNLKAVGTNGGPLTIEGVDGEIEARNTNNAITLTNVAGSVVANRTNGNVKATLTRVTDKPMAFTSFNGNVDVTLPASLKATFKLRSDMGDLFTDFDLQVKTDTTTSPNPQRENGQLRIVVNKSLTGTLNGGGPEIELRTFNGYVYLRKGQ